MDYYNHDLANEIDNRIDTFNRNQEVLCDDLLNKDNIEIHGITHTYKIMEGQSIDAQLGEIYYDINTWLREVWDTENGSHAVARLWRKYNNIEALIYMLYYSSEQYKKTRIKPGTKKRRKS